jgi:hypothetical protein
MSRAVLLALSLKAATAEQQQQNQHAHQRIVCQGVLDARMLVSDNCEGRHFAAGAAGGGNGHKLRYLA